MRAILFLFLVLAGCGEGVQDNHFANSIDPGNVEPVAIKPPPVPVRIGELGPSFAACNAVGTSRQPGAAAAEGLDVRAALFEASAEAGSIPAGARFFICTRSHDQRWLGVVFDPSGALSDACGVSRPVTSRRNYEGPCRSGWVSAAFVKQIAG